MGVNKDARDRLRDFLTKAAESAVTITDFRRLPGGAVQENWLLDITVAGGDWPGKHNLVLRRDAATPVAASHGRLQEFQILNLAHKAGVTVPTPCLMGEDPAVIGGLVARVGDRVIDGSTRTKLSAMRRDLVDRRS